MRLKIFCIVILLCVSTGVLWAENTQSVSSTQPETRTVDGITETRLVTTPDQTDPGSGVTKEPGPTVTVIDDIDQYMGIFLWQTGDTYGMCNDCAISPDGYYMAMGVSLNNQRGECLEAPSPTPLWQYYVGDVNSKVAISQYGGVYVLGYGQYVSIFNTTTSTPIWTYDAGAGNWVYQVAVSRNGNLIVAAWIEGSTGHVTAFTPLSATPVWDVEMTVTTGFPWYGLRICADASRISANTKFEAWVLDAASGNILWETFPNNTESPIPMSEDGSILAIGLNAGGYLYAYEWNTATSTYDLLWTYVFTGGYSRWCNEVEVSADGNTIAAGSLEFLTGGDYDGHAAVFDTEGGGIPLWISDTFGDLVGEIAMSDDGQVIAIGGWGDLDNTLTDLRLYERESPYPFYTLNHPGSINSVDISADGGMVFAGGKHVHNRIYGNGGDAYLIRIDQDYPNVDISLTPYGAPIQIPANGGSFDFNLEIFNTEDDPVTFDAWITCITPTGYEVGPLFGPATVTLPGGISIERDRTQFVPIGAPPGTYTYNAYMGDFPSVIWDDDFFQFEKLAGVEWGLPIGDWANIGEDLAGDETAFIPENHHLAGCYPNPFNPATTISYQLTADSRVHLAVYDITGRQVAQLVDGWRDAGVHDVTFDATRLASGMYIYRIEAGDFTAQGKMVLMK